MDQRKWDREMPGDQAGYVIKQAQRKVICGVAMVGLRVITVKFFTGRVRVQISRLRNGGGGGREGTRIPNSFT